MKITDNITLRDWQALAVQKAQKWLLEEKKDKKFLVNAAPGSGKTFMACALAKILIDKKEIDRVVILAPRKKVVDQWKNDFKLITGRSVLVLEGKMMQEIAVDICATWAKVKNDVTLFQHMCKKEKVLVICDEHHHAAREATWGISAGSSFKDSKYSLVLTGTPIRTDGSSSVWFSFTEGGEKLEHPEAGTYQLSYGESIKLGYCRPATFHNWEGKFSVKKEGEDYMVTGTNGVKLSDKDIKKSLAKDIQDQLDFGHLIKVPDPTYVDSKGEKIDLKRSMQASMLEAGIEQLERTKELLPQAAGLVIAPSIPMAKYMAKILEKLTGEKPYIVHNDESGSHNLIDVFKNNDKDWIVSVDMISEGVDIPRLRTLVYLPRAQQSELHFRQALGRVVRRYKENLPDISFAHVIMPKLPFFEECASRVESDMKSYHVNGKEPNNVKVCPSCQSENNKKNKFCDCGYEFQTRQQKTKPCPSCNIQNPIRETNCMSCGESFEKEIEIELKEAVRMGTWAQEIQHSEEDSKYGAKWAHNTMKKMLASNDTKGMEMLSKFSPETIGAIIKLTKDKRYKEDLDNSEEILEDLKNKNKKNHEEDKL